jgi:SRSO17 transposase
MNERQLQACSHRLEAFMTELLTGIGRSERREHGALYIQGLLLDGERKSTEPLAVRVPGGNVQALQQFVGQSPWAWEPVREQLAQRMQEALLPVAGWIIDDTGFPKQGSDSVGVARQYSGTLGKVGNCQIAVSIHLTTEEESTPLDWALYLPREWIDDPERCLKAGVPENTLFCTKPELALALTDQLRQWGLTQLPVLADTAYGRSTEFRQGLVDRQLQYVVGVDPDTAIWTEPTRPIQPPRQGGKGRPPGPYYKDKPTGLEAMAPTLTTREWKKVRWREGSQGPQESRFAARRVQPAHGHGRNQAELEEVWVLIEWPTQEKAPIQYWFSNLPPDTSLKRLVRLAKLRWRVEQNYQQLKEELGLDHYEGRGWRGWHHHVTLVCLAYAFLMLERQRSKKNSDDDSA